MIRNNGNGTDTVCAATGTGIDVLSNISYGAGNSFTIGSTTTIATGIGSTYRILNDAGTRLYAGINNAYFTVNTSDNTFTTTSLSGLHDEIAVDPSGTTLYIPSRNTSPGRVDIVNLP